MIMFFESGDADSAPCFSLPEEAEESRKSAIWMSSPSLTRKFPSAFLPLTFTRPLRRSLYIEERFSSLKNLRKILSSLRSESSFPAVKCVKSMRLIFSFRDMPRARSGSQGVPFRFLAGQFRLFQGHKRCQLF